MTGTLTVAWASILRAMRHRRALFFSLALPVLVITVVGMTFRSFDTIPVGVVGASTSPTATRLARTLADSPALEVTRFASIPAARTALRRSEVDAALVIPDDLPRRLAGGGRVILGVLAEEGNATAQAAAVEIDAAVARFAGEVGAARFATTHAGVGFEAGLALATRLEGSLPAVATRTVTAEASAETLPAGCSYSAPTMLVLFVFINALAGGAVIVGTRRLHLYERMLAAPVTAGAVVVGELLATFALALTQAALIVVVGHLLFGVSWGDPLGAGVLVVLWALVGAGAGVLAGSLFRTPEQAGAIGPAIGIALGMLGGCMWPLSIVSSTMRAVGHATPQAWAVDAWTMLISRHAHLGAVAPKLGVLVAFAAGLLLLAAARFRRVLA